MDNILIKAMELSIESRKKTIGGNVVKEIMKRINNFKACADEYKHVVGPERMKTETEINERYEYLMGRASLLESILREALTAYENEA